MCHTPGIFVWPGHAKALNLQVPQEVEVYGLHLRSQPPRPSPPRPSPPPSLPPSPALDQADLVSSSLPLTSPLLPLMAELVRSIVIFHDVFRLALYRFETFEERKPISLFTTNGNSKNCKDPKGVKPKLACSEVKNPSESSPALPFLPLLHHQRPPSSHRPWPGCGASTLTGECNFITSLKNI